MEPIKIPAWLLNTTIEEVLLQGQATSALDQSHAVAELTLVVASKGINPGLLVISHEILLRAGETCNKALAEAYCQTMPDTFLHNWWGMPGENVEQLGQTLISFGATALPYLSRLLDNKHPLGYFGSEETTLSQLRHYRVCDLAAYFITEIIGITYPKADDLADRDGFIEDLRLNLLPKVNIKSQPLTSNDHLVQRDNDRQRTESNG